MAKSKKEKEEKAESTGSKSLDDIKVLINKQYGKSVAANGDCINSEYIYLPTGIFPLDLDLGGGLILGRKYEFWGEQGSGKSVTAAKAGGNAQKRCSVCHKLLEDCKSTDHEPTPMHVTYFNLEKSLDKHWYKCLGFNIDNTLIVEPDHLEMMIDIGEELIDNAATDLIIIDSVDNLPPLKWGEKSAEDGIPMAETAVAIKKLKRWLAKMKTFRWCKPITLIGINQIRNDPNKYGQAYSPGGNFGRHFWDTRIQFAKSEKAGERIDEVSGESVATELTYDTVKNRTFPPRRKGNFTLYTQNDPTGQERWKKADFNNNEKIIDAAVKRGLIRKGGAWYYVLLGNGEEETFQGKKELEKFFCERQDKLWQLADAVIQRNREISLGF